MATPLVPPKIHGAPALEVVFYRDILCVWCHLAALRLDRVRHLLGPYFTWKVRPFPLRTAETVVSVAERAAALRRLDRVSKEPDAGLLVPDLWTGDDLPGSSLMAMAAVEAASFQSLRAARDLDAALRAAAFERGLNVTRLGVILEIAESVRTPGFDPVRLSREIGGGRVAGWRDRILDRRGDAVQLGVGGVPSVVVAGRVLSGARSTDTYLDVLLEVLGSAHGPGFALPGA
jgi:predicted DsbA family dithiol-disulfide isomerase